MDIGKANTTILQEESTLGIYVWEMPDGRWIGDEDGNFLSITSKKGNRSRVDALASPVVSSNFIDTFRLGLLRVDFYLSVGLLFRVRNLLTLLFHHYAVKSLQLRKQTHDSLLVRI